MAGILVGLPTGVALEYARRAYNEATFADIDRQFESQGMSPPLMIDLLQPWVVPILTTIAVMSMAILIYGVSILRKRS